MNADLCPCCTAGRPIRARGLCKVCYERHRMRGTLSQYPARYRVSAYSRSPDVDDIAVERACHGDPVQLTILERAAVVQILTRRGHSARSIAARIGVAMRTVQRYRAHSRQGTSDATCDASRNRQTPGVSSDGADQIINHAREAA